MSVEVRDAGVALRPDPSRTLAHFFLPGAATPGATSRVDSVTDRILALSAREVADAAPAIDRGFADRHRDLPAILASNGAMLDVAGPDSDDFRSVHGATFTAESAVEGVALCNPSVVLAPDQSGLAPGAHRVVVSLRAIGEGHVSTLAFCTATVGPGRS